MYGQQQRGGYPGNASQSGYGGYPGNQQQQPPRSGGYPGAQPQQYQAQQSYRPQAYSAPPQQNASQGIESWFRAVDTDNSGQIDAAELKKALVNGNWTNFSEEACTIMISLYDKNSTGTIDVNEFQALYSCINEWKATFESIDSDKSGAIEQNELIQAFQQMGYRFTPTFIQNLLAKYDPQNRRLTLDNFIVSSIQIKRLTDSFRVRDKEMKGHAALGYEDFIGLALGTHH
ncbi:peflin isoform X1 [Lepeophtheirus salmonis]|uniref:Peflin n=1 Tax=Lepeophtheirus salmonis TaxID=72036 RepID=C1BVX9_LEPSM|nr:peflin-like isoform X1 [Lepeophtheirus salmonis]ACO13182.1 Peflin [Lepeophtheirus salmonis]